MLTIVLSTHPKLGGCDWGCVWLHRRCFEEMHMESTPIQGCLRMWKSSKTDRKHRIWNGSWIYPVCLWRRSGLRHSAQMSWRLKLPYWKTQLDATLVILIRKGSFLLSVSSRGRTLRFSGWPGHATSEKVDFPSSFDKRNLWAVRKNKLHLITEWAVPVPHSCSTILRDPLDFSFSRSCIALMEHETLPGQESKEWRKAICKVRSMQKCVGALCVCNVCMFSVRVRGEHVFNVCTLNEEQKYPNCVGVRY